MMWLNTMNCRMIQFHLNYFIISILLINQLLCNFCAAKQINNTLITKKHNNHDIKRKFTIDELQYMRFPKRISDDIDLDPCKTGGFLGDISMPNQDAEAEWRKQNRRNKDIQADIEKLKQEVYNEGLQVEEEGLTDIVRKKTKLPYQSNENDRLHHNNDPAIYARNSEGPQQKTHSHSRAISSQDYHGSASDIKVVILDNGGQQMSVTHEAIKVVTPESEQPVEKKLNVPPIDSHDHRKIHSDTKSIEDNSGDNLMYDKSISAIPTTTVSSRTTESSYITNDTTTGTKSSVRIRRSRRRREQNTITKKQIDYMGLLSKKYQTLENAKQDLKPLMDIALSSESERTKKIQRQHHRVTRAATAKKERIWDYGVIPYEIDGNFSGAHKTLFKQAMKHWENHTCIKFVERNPAEHPNYIVFTERACGCCSFVGKRGNGAQAISIGKNCDKFGIIVHELGHVVGFWHEHTRPDRDNHVVIERVNIMKGQEYNFNMLTADDVNSLGLPYDYDSIMHYARNTFSKGTFLDTILPIEVVGKKRPEIGQRVKLSEGDISQARLLYNCPKCGRTYQENAGSFTSPSYFSLIPPEEPEICEWRITATHGEKIVLNITDLDIFKSNNCRSDYLEIRDGYWHKSPILGRYCGSGKLNTLITTTGSRMLLSYVTTQRQTNHRGFAVNYEAICGGTLELEQGRLESPNYPLDYLANKECIWKITVPDDFQVALKFQSFEIENHDNCSYDYVEIREGDSPTSRLIGIFCGFKLPPDIRSSTNKMFVKFVSDGSVQKAGFSATFMKEYDECEKLDHGCEHECINLLGGYQCACDIGYELHSDKKSCEDACGGIINDLNGTITSPSFPHEYPSTKECVWEIITPPQYRITMNFTHFDLEGNNFYQQECEYDSLTLYSKLDGDPLKRHGVYCGNRLPPMITSESNTLRIEFRSDKTVQKSGFAAMFFTDIDECAINNGGCQHDCKNTIGSYVCSCHNGFTLHENEHDCKEGGCKYEITTPKGNVYSPNFPDNYPPNKDCVWHFTTTPGHRIKLVFTFFDVEPHQECAYDNVTIYNGDSPESYMLGRFCGGKVPHPISATSNEMYMIFKSDTSVHRKGFKAIHSTSCGGSLVATNLVKHFYSHSKYGDDNYDIDTDCEWTIYAEQGRNVRLTFLTFELESEKNCGFDYVDIFGGYDDYSGTKYGRYCGTTSPPDIISIGEALLVRFRTDASNTFTGFSASYVALDPYSGEITDEESEESYTPFPGSLKSMVISHIDENDENGEDDYDDNSEDYIDYRSVIEKSRSKFKQQEIEVPRNLMSGED